MLSLLVVPRRLGRKAGVRLTMHPAARAWDAASAFRAAVRAAGAARHVLVAEAAVRLARQGYVSEVRFDVADGTPLDVLRATLRELAPAAAAEADARLDAYEAADAARVPAPDPDAHGSPCDAAGDERRGPDPAPFPEQGIAPDRLPDACAKRSRACLVCGTVFEVNFRHADEHKFCSAACRSRHRRRRLAGIAPSGVTNDWHQSSAE